MSFSLKVRAKKPAALAALAVGEFLKVTATQDFHDDDRPIIARALADLADDLPKEEEGRTLEVEAYGSTTKEWDGAAYTKFRSMDVSIKVRSVADEPTT